MTEITQILYFLSSGGEEVLRSHSSLGGQEQIRRPGPNALCKCIYRFRSDFSMKTYKSRDGGVDPVM